MITEYTGDEAGRKAIGSQRKWARLPDSPPAQRSWALLLPLQRSDYSSSSLVALQSPVTGVSSTPAHLR